MLDKIFGGRKVQFVNITNDTVLSKVTATISSLEKLSQKDLLATPHPDFVMEYNRTRATFIGLNPSLTDATPPEILDQCRYVEILTYSKQILNLVRDVFLKR